MSPTDHVISKNADHMFTIFIQNVQKPKQKIIQKCKLQSARNNQKNKQKTKQ